MLKVTIDTVSQTMKANINERGVQGYSAYELATLGDEGFKGTLDEWLASLKGGKGDQGPPVPVANKLGESEELAVSQKLLTDIVGDIESAVDRLLGDTDD